MSPLRKSGDAGDWQRMDGAVPSASWYHSLGAQPSRIIHASNRRVLIRVDVP
jgi:hypothetical protein